VIRQRFKSKILHSPFFILHSTFSILHSPFYILHSSFSILHSPFYILHSPFYIHFVKYYTNGNQKKRANSGIFSKNVRYTAFLIAEHAVRAVRFCAHRRPERSRRIYRGINVDFTDYGGKSSIDNRKSSIERRRVR
jgi:hypothetical protein